jgi:hypothetical protein
MLVVSRFIYDLAGLPKPTDDELDEEIDRLLYIETAEEPNYLVDPNSQDALAAMDAEILSLWFVKKFKPVLMMLLLQCQDNYQKSKEELCKMKRYDSFWSRRLRAGFVQIHSVKRVREFFFANASIPTLEHATADIKRLLTLIAEHLDRQEDLTLFNTDRYTVADVRLYNFLKRIVIGKYRNDGLASHLRLCDPLVRFMRRYARKNTNIIDISSGDPLASNDNEPSLVADLVKSASVGLGFIFLFLYLRSK